MIFKLNKFYIDFPSKIENTLKKIPDFLIKDGISKYVNIYKELFFGHNGLAFIIKDLNNKFYIIIFENINSCIVCRGVSKNLINEDYIELRKTTKGFRIAKTKSKKLENNFIPNIELTSTDDSSINIKIEYYGKQSSCSGINQDKLSQLNSYGISPQTEIIKLLFDNVHIDMKDRTLYKNILDCIKLC